MIHIIGIFIAVLAALWVFDWIKERRRRKAVARGLYNLTPQLYLRSESFTEPVIEPVFAAPVIEPDGPGWLRLMDGVIALGVIVVLVSVIFSWH